MRAIGRKLITTGAALLLCAAGLASAGAVATAKPGEGDTLQAKVDYFLGNSVGGVQTAPNEITFDGGKVILTVAPPEGIGIQAADCPFTYACLYDGTNFNYPRLALSACGTVSLSTYSWQNRPSSIHNNQTSGTQTIIFNSSGGILNANVAPSRVNDVGVGGTNRATSWRVC